MIQNAEISPFATDDNAKPNKSLQQHHRQNPQANGPTGTTKRKQKNLIHRFWHHRQSGLGGSISSSTIDDDDSTLADMTMSPTNTGPTTLRASINCTLPSEVEVIYVDHTTANPPRMELWRKSEIVEERHRTIPAEAPARGFQNQKDGIICPIDKSTEGPVVGVSNTACATLATTTEEHPALQQFELALMLCSQNQLDDSLGAVQKGLTLLTNNHPLYWKLKTIQAEILGRTGNYEESLRIFQTILQHCAPNVIQAAVYFACARLSVYLQRYQEALEYYTQELLLTKTLFGESLAVSRILHDLAKLCEEGLGDLTQALVYYEQALFIEVSVWRTADRVLKNGGIDHDTQVTDDYWEAQQQIPETRKCIGRIQFSLGNIDEALRFSSRRFY